MSGEGGAVGDGGAARDGDDDPDGGRPSDDGAGGSTDPGAPGTDCARTYEGETGAWVEQPALMVDGDARTWWTWIPAGYDPEMEYPVVFLFHGCGDETNNVPLEQEAGDEAILVRGLANGPDGCWLTASTTNGNFFEAMLEAVSELACIDNSEVFAVGYDSGAELVSRLGCYQAYLISGVATIAGDNALTSNPTCNGPVAALMIHDEGDMQQDISGSEEVRDRLIDQNFCVTDGIPENVDPDPCLRYSGCGDPVIWCGTTGAGHDRQDDFAVPTIWNFFTSL